MPDLETRMPELLRRAAMVAPPDDGFQQRLLRRARRRRVLNASGTGLVAIALVAGAVVGSQSLLRSTGTTPADESPSPGPGAAATPIQAVWPETTAEELAASQARADAGELPWRLDPVRTATAFATVILGWDPADVQAEETGRPRIGTAFVSISNLGLGPGADSQTPAPPETVVTLRQLGTTDGGGVWSVVRTESDRIELDTDSGPPASGSTLTAHLVDTVQEWSPGLLIVVDGRQLGTVSLIMTDPSGALALRLPELGGAVPEGATIGVVVALWDPEGTLVTAETFPYTVVPGTGGPAATGPTGATGPVDEIPEEIPSAVLATRDQIAIAAETRDYDALEALIDPNRFSYNFDDGSNPVPEWRKDPSVLDTLATLLQMPVTTTEGTPDVGTIYVWPSLVNADLANPTADDRWMLETLGITDADVRAMLDAFGGYVGPRTGVAEDGTWLFYTTGGD